MLDRIYAIVSLLTVILFVGIITVGVMEPDLWIVAFIVIGISIFDFWQTLRTPNASKNGSEN